MCNYQRYGRGGGQETKNALCVLSLNMINDKVSILYDTHHCLWCTFRLLPSFGFGIASSSLLDSIGERKEVLSGKNLPTASFQNHYKECPNPFFKSSILPHEDDDASVP